MEKWTDQAYVLSNFFFSLVIYFIYFPFFLNFLTLQYCIGFSIYQHESDTGIHPVAPQDEASLTKTFQTWPRGWFHIP